MEQVCRVLWRARVQSGDLWRGPRLRARQGLHVQAESLRLRNRVAPAVGELHRVQHAADVQLCRAGPLRLRRDLGRLARRQRHHLLRAGLVRRHLRRPRQGLSVPAIGHVCGAETDERRRKPLGRHSDVHRRGGPHLLLRLCLARHCPSGQPNKDGPGRPLSFREGFGSCHRPMRLLRSHALRPVLRREPARGRPDNGCFAAVLFTACLASGRDRCLRWCVRRADAGIPRRGVGCYPREGNAGRSRSRDAADAAAAVARGMLAHDLRCGHWHHVRGSRVRYRGRVVHARAPSRPRVAGRDSHERGHCLYACPCRRLLRRVPRAPRVPQ
mmetsp:Transcript_31473/g.86571  ORF Transcript_31473/g.86571 Transcript_31473/m.86571 type:complete len:328 (-) Transcript_31473:1225-2208(-)